MDKGVSLKGFLQYSHRGIETNTMTAQERVLLCRVGGTTTITTEESKCERFYINVKAKGCRVCRPLVYLMSSY